MRAPRAGVLGGGHAADANRSLFVKVDTRMREWDLMGLIGSRVAARHRGAERSERHQRRRQVLRSMCERRDPAPSALAFEPDAAIEAGEAVRTEARKSSPRTVAR